jgi:dTDP-4-dehydrorhamnose reductase
VKVVLTGARGQVGRATIRSKPAWADLSALTHEELDVSDPVQVSARLLELRPQLIINAAAYTAVDAAESDEARASAVNEGGPRALAEVAKALGARLLHLSTDYVFDGERARPYSPQHDTRPLGAYGRTKLAGEVAVRTTHPHGSIVLRTSWVYAQEGKNFLRTMLRLMAEKGSVRVVADQIGAPTAADSIAEVLWRMAEHAELRGLYHWADAGAASWYDFAVAIAEEAQALGKLRGPVVVTPIPTEDYPTAARRPAFSLLDTRETTQALGLTPLHWRVWLRRVLGEMQLA